MTVEPEETKPFYEDEEEYQRDIQNEVDKLDKKIGWPNANNGTLDQESDEPKRPKKTKEKPEYSVFKYSKRFKSTLHEAIILKDKPVFLRYKNGNIEIVDKIIEDHRTLVPPNIEEYPYEPIEFNSNEEIAEYLSRAKQETIESLFQRVFRTISLYIDQDEDIRTIISADIIWTYFQDLFPTTHYYDISGTGNGIDKSTIGFMFEGIGYRCVRMTDPSAANIFRVLGKIEVGQCTIVLDEADKIHKDREIVSILKEGYAINGKVPKVNRMTDKQEFFYCYGFKIRIAEEPIKHGIAKGVIDRTFSIRAIKGDPKCDIKEVLHPARRNEANEKLYEELRDIKKLQLMYRMIHFEDPILDIDTGYSGRDKELCKPLFQLFHNSESYVKVINAVRSFLELKNKRKNTVAVEPVLYKITNDMLNMHHDNGLKFYKNGIIPIRDIWSEIISGNEIGGVYDEKKPNMFESFEYGTLYKNTISTVLEGFGADIVHGKKGNSLAFDIDRFKRIGKMYEAALEEMRKGECSEGSEPPIGKNPDNLHPSDMKSSEASMLPYTASQPSSPSPSTSEVTESRIYFQYGNWYCKNCSMKGDRFYMQDHKCR